MAREIRIGKISSINYAAGMAKVVYTDKDNAVTREIPFLSDEYHMPEIGDQVLVLHLSNGAEAGIIMGRPWSDKNVPPQGVKGIYRKELGRTPGECYLRYNASTKTLDITCAGTIRINGNVLVNGVSVP